MEFGTWSLVELCGALLLVLIALAIVAGLVSLFVSKCESD
ncbi:MAG: hypothetical protein ACI841_003336 [Planctomycetota bacterium]|jgi:hypothetical protein